MSAALVAAVVGGISAYHSARIQADAVVGTKRLRYGAPAPSHNYFKTCAYCGVTSDRTNRTNCPQCGAP